MFCELEGKANRFRLIRVLVQKLTDSLRAEFRQGILSPSSAFWPSHSPDFTIIDADGRTIVGEVKSRMPSITFGGVRVARAQTEKHDPEKGNKNRDESQESPIKKGRYMGKLLPALRAPRLSDRFRTLNAELNSILALSL